MSRRNALVGPKEVISNSNTEATEFFAQQYEDKTESDDDQEESVTIRDRQFEFSGTVAKKELLIFQS